MRKKKIIIILLIVFTLIMTACGNDNENTSSAGKDVSKEDILNESGFPIVKEPIDLTFFTGKSGTNGDKFEETLVWSEYAKQSGINVNFELVPFESLTEKRNLALAGGDYPDGFYSARVSSADLAKYGKQGVFIPLDDLIDQYAPNFKKILEENPDVKKGLTMPDGHIYSFPSFYDPSFLPMLIGTPLWVKEEWIEKLDMEEPTTPEEFYQYLKAVKETDLNGNGEKDEIPFSATGTGALLDQLKGAWGLGNRGLGHKHIDIDPETNELRFFRLDDKYKELLEYVNMLYTEDLIDPEVFTQDSTQLYAKGADNRLGATIVPNPSTLMNDDNFIGLGALKGPHGDQLYTHLKVPMVHVGAFVITDKNPYPEATVRWIDHFFGEEGATFYFMGKEGETYEKLEDGTLEYTKDITDNPDGLTHDQALAKNFTWLGGSYPGYVKADWFNGSETLPNSLAAGEKASPYVIEELWNSFNFTDEENRYLQSEGADLQTYMDEMEAKFITGEESFDGWDKYVEQVKKMGLDNYMEVQNEAYKRYMAE
ncbi:extracellular solute-binding protein [Lederbergia galactosidilytica]|uniref:ABC transporter substrate-binding protein n=1 Tax=Lederbergia galactosidilytica TaxID=217031 RepID=A0A177ZST3_9BACI|nr:extracellular solute-binding protein [Lederbergia galactosidilytica]KRG14395.1 ABC transporter substrate-binding protein [Virgibacillus soli]MBP1916723.1 putative aldouronate transport system substrate-binding protein [Lederbergia galactosidilytica]OAK70972.1 ABC transporter substrate-binding protein [Lederbergia galactosidilytica]